MIRFHAAVIVDVMEFRAEEKDPGDGDHGVPESVVSPYAGRGAEQQDSVAPQCGS